jgi:hypothetical protein
MMIKLIKFTSASWVDEWIDRSLYVWWELMEINQWNYLQRYDNLKIACEINIYILTQCKIIVQSVIFCFSILSDDFANWD